MGSCSSVEQTDELEHQESSKLDKALEKRNDLDKKVVKLLLLGTGESGKSTIFKQMQILYLQESFTDIEKRTFRQVLRRNLVESMQALVLGMERFGVQFQNAHSAVAAKAVMNVDPGEVEVLSEEIVRNIQALWISEPSIRTVYNNRSKIQLLDSAQYLFENAVKLGRHDFVPSPDDILRARLRTTGIVEKTFAINGLDFKFLDVGGQRNERRRWIHCFDGVTALIFVAAISEYDQVMYEDEKENRLLEAIRVFDTIINNQYFQQSTIVLFLNKIDLFMEKLNKSLIRDTFVDYDGENTYEEASTFIRDKFLEANKDKNRAIFHHLTCATDTSNVSRVFEACKQTILQRNLRRLGLD